MSVTLSYHFTSFLISFSFEIIFKAVDDDEDGKKVRFCQIICKKKSEIEMNEMWQ